MGDAEELRRSFKDAHAALPRLQRHANGQPRGWGVEARPREDNIFIWDVTVSAAIGEVGACDTYWQLEGNLCASPP